MNPISLPPGRGSALYPLLTVITFEAEAVHTKLASMFLICVHYCCVDENWKKSGGNVITMYEFTSNKFVVTK